MDGPARDRARQLLTTLRSSLSGEQWDTALKVLAGEDPDLDRELRQLLAEASAAITAPSDPNAIRTDSGAPMNPQTDVPGVHIGPWIVIRTLGEGGFGVVYLAERADRLFDRQVAIKLMRTGAAAHSLMARFEAERRILAMLQHPNIAQLIDAGTTDEGQPYFVMEYVDGQPLTKYTKEHNLHPDEILRLFLPICHALDFAHQRLIVHRDLKPANILVSNKGEVKLLDFGIAKLLDAALAPAEALTAPGHQPLTLRYASPEQVLGDPVSTRTDVYALGVVLYEAIRGQPPYAGKLDSLMRGILEVDPPPPTLDAPKRLREIDAIVLTALQKDPSGRYASAREMGEDIERYLSGRPVRAHGDSRGYRLRKFIRRNRAGVLAAALVLLSLLGGIIATTRESRIANAERTRAETQAELARQRQQQAETAQSRAQARASDVRGLARDLLVDLQEIVSKLPGGGAAHEQLVNRAITYLQRMERDSSGEPELELAIALGYRKLGDLYNYIYRPGSPSVQRQLDAYMKSTERVRPLLAKQPGNPEYRVAMAAAESGAGDALVRMDRSSEAVTSWRRAMGLLDGIGTPEALGMRGGTQMQLARQLWRETSRPETPVRMARQAVDWKRAATLREPNRPGVWRLLANNQATLALVLAESGNYSAAINALQDANASLDKALLRQSDDFLARRDRVMFLLLRGNFESRFASTEQAVATFQKASQEADRLLEIDPGNVNVRYDSGNAQNWLGLLLARLGKTTEARQHFQKQVEAFTALTKDDTTNLGYRESLHSAYLQLGDSFADENRYADAEPAYRAALAESEQMAVLSKGSPAMLREQAFSCGRLAEVGLNTGNTVKGLEWARQAIDLHGKTVAAEPRNAEYLLSLALAWGMQGQIERRLRRGGGNYEELDSYRRAMQLLERSLQLHPNDREKMSFLAGHTHPLGQRLLETGATAEAAATLHRGRDLLEQLTAADPKVVRYQRDLALVLSLLGEAEQADRVQSCSTLRRAQEMALVLEKDAKRPNPLLAQERFTRLLAGCESR